MTYHFWRELMLWLLCFFLMALAVLAALNLL
jgi:hypothetical protein